MAIPTRLASTEDVLQFASDAARRYVRTAHTRRVSPVDTALRALSRLHEPFPERSCDPGEVIGLLDEVGSPATVVSTGGRYFGFVNGGALPASVGAHWLAGVWDQNANYRVASPIAAELEDILQSWICDALGLPPGCEIGLVTGATIANFSGILAARHALLSRAGWNVEEEGMFGAPEIDVVVGAEVHPSVLKALSMAGFGRRRVKIVEADAQGRMMASKLPKLGPNTIVCLQAGNVNSGSFDPAREICARAKEVSAWVHVDGAFGLWVKASRRFQHLADGFEHADSWATDAHKWPNANYDCGIVVVRDAMPLRAAFSITAAYLQAGVGREPINQTPDASRRARGVELWAALKSLGRQGLEDLIDRTCAHAMRFAMELRRTGFEVLNDVVINQVLVSFGTNEETEAVIRAIQADGTCWCGGTVWRGRKAMRISVSSWATTEEDVERSIAAIIRIAKSGE